MTYIKLFFERLIFFPNSYKEVDVYLNLENRKSYIEEHEWEKRLKRKDSYQSYEKLDKSSLNAATSHLESSNRFFTSF